MKKSSVFININGKHSVSAISAKEERVRFELIQLMHNLVKRQV
ncbi:hypothetical protein MHB46_01225 [Paenibacillus sp. FSL H7-0703]